MMLRQVFLAQTRAELVSAVARVATFVFAAAAALPEPAVELVESVPNVFNVSRRCGILTFASDRD